MRGGSLSCDRNGCKQGEKLHREAECKHREESTEEEGNVSGYKEMLKYEKVVLLSFFRKERKKL